jgi:hypothetical protein
MKHPGQSIPILKLLLGYYRFGILPVCIYFAAISAVLLVSAVYWPEAWMEAHNHPANWSASALANCIPCWCFLMFISTPLPFQVLGGVMSIEFIFTRAVDRGLWLRTGRLGVIILVTGPLLLNLALSAWGPQLAFEPASAGSLTTAVEQRYMQVFPGSHWSADAAGTTGQLVIQHGSVMFAAWLVWFSLLSIFVVAAWFTWVFLAWQRAGWHHSQSKLRPWLGGLIVHLPALLPLTLLLVCAGYDYNAFEQSFLLFASHPFVLSLVLAVLMVGVQVWSERNIRKLEFEFF